MNTDSLLIYVLILLVVVIVFLLIREVLCWYWKINTRIELQEEQIKLQKEILNLLEKITKNKDEESEQLKTN